MQEILFLGFAQCCLCPSALSPLSPLWHPDGSLLLRSALEMGTGILGTLLFRPSILWCCCDSGSGCSDSSGAGAGEGLVLEQHQGRVPSPWVLPGGHVHGAVPQVPCPHSLFVSVIFLWFLLFQPPSSMISQEFFSPSPSLQVCPK